jgi:hypothetical protein
MNLQIQCYDVTKNYSLDEYSPQKGDTVRFKTNLKDKDIKEILWTMCSDNNEYTYDQHCISHIFTKTYQNTGPGVTSENEYSEVPGEGYVTVKCTVKTIDNHILTNEKTLLIVPQINCEFMFEEWSKIDSNTRYIDLQGGIMCENLNLGNPFNGNPEYSCGGACFEECPRYEIIIPDNISTTRIWKYGKHKIFAHPELYGPPEAHELCIPLYQNNHLGQNSKYPPSIAKICIVPREEELEIKLSKYRCNKTFERVISIDGLSQFMMPCKFKIKWTIKTIKNNKVIKKRCNVGSNISVIYNFCKEGEYDIKAKIIFPCCDIVKTKCKVLLFHNQLDIIECPQVEFIQEPIQELEEEEEEAAAEPVPI